MVSATACYCIVTVLSEISFCIGLRSSSGIWAEVAGYGDTNEASICMYLVCKLGRATANPHVSLVTY
jgi:hypothetical protein